MKWIKQINILSSIRLLLMLLAVVLMLSACSGNDSEHGDTRPVDDSTINSTVAGHKASCWQGDILDTVYEAIGMTVMTMFNKLTKGAMNVMMMAFALWLAFRLLKFLSSFSEDNPGEIWNEIIRKAGICLFCGYLASSSTMALTVVNDLLFPIYNSFLEFGGAIMQEATKNTSADLNKFTVLGDPIDASAYPLLCTVDPKAVATLDRFPDSTQKMMKCMICALSSRLVIGMKISLSVMGTGVTGFVVGFVMLASFVSVYLGFAFYLVDSIFKFGVMILMLPLLILSYAFEATRNWTSKGFANIMESAVFMMAVCLLLTMTIVAMITIISAPEFAKVFQAGEADFADASIPMMCLLLLAFLVSGSLGVAAHVAGALIGTKVSTKFQEKLKAVASMVLNWISAGVSGKIESVLKMAKGGRTATKMRDKLNQMAGRR